MGSEEDSIGAAATRPGMLSAAIVYSLAAIVAVAGAPHRSRWYVTSAFTTFLVFLLLLYSDPHDAASRFNERVLETLLGVGIAYAYGLGLPWLVQRSRARRSVRSPRDGPGSRD
jgi:hypothetical protein